MSAILIMMTSEYDSMKAPKSPLIDGSAANRAVDQRQTLFPGLLAVLTVLALASCERQASSNAPSDEDALVSLAAVVSQKVVTIEAIGSDSQDAQTGSGFFVTEDGKVATCAHLVEGAKSIRVKTLSGAEFKFMSVVSLDSTKDLALLSVATDGVACFDHSGPEVSVGTRIAVLGNPLGLRGSLTDGVVSAIRGGADDVRFLQISAPVSPGSSGSPVVSLAGDLVGMVGARAQGGEGIGFALASEEIWAAINEAAAKKDDQAPYREALEMSRRRYLPSRELWDDPEWENGNLPEATSQRLAVLRRLSSKYPDVALLRVEIAQALREDGDYDQAFEECAALVSRDPGNRLAVSELIGTITKEERKIPFVKSAVNADPLNFHARRYLFEQEGHDDEFLSAQLSARRALETAPFSLRISEGYAEALLDHELHELAIRDRPFESFHGEMIRNAISDSNELRKVVAAAALMLADPSEEALEEFLDLAEESPARALPYAWELAQLGRQGKEEVKAVISGPIGDRLQSFVREAIKNEPLIAEAYLLDPGAVDVREGLLIDAIGAGHSRFFPSFGVEPPFDQVGMLFLLADHQADGESESSVEGPEAVVQWLETLKAYSESGKALGGIMPRISTVGKGTWREPLIFDFWLATQKRRLGERLNVEGLTEDEKTKLEAALTSLGEVPSTADAEQAVRALMKERQMSLWEYFGPEYRRPLERAFEAAASR